MSFPPVILDVVEVVLKRGLAPEILFKKGVADGNISTEEKHSTLLVGSATRRSNVVNSII